MAKTVEQLEQELAIAKQQLDASKKLIKEKDEALKTSKDDNKALQKEFNAFKAQAVKEIEAAQKANVVIISDKVIEHDGKKFEFTMNEFGVIGEKGRFKSSDIIKDPVKHKDLLDKLIKMKSGILKELVVEAPEEN